MIIFSLNTFYRFSQKTNILFIQNRRYSGNTFPPQTPSALFPKYLLLENLQHAR